MADFPGEFAPLTLTLAAAVGATSAAVHAAEYAPTPILLAAASEGAANACGSPLYLLAAYDAAGRRYWQSAVFSFASAPTPTGAWIVPSLTQVATLSS
jgi:hypothetical protein